MRQNGGVSRRTELQQVSQTGPSRGVSSTRAQATHTGASTTESSAFAPRTIASRVRLVVDLVTFGVAPEPLESIERSALTAEDVDDEVEVVEQDPF